MKIGIYYGGRGEIEDPTLYVIDIIKRVLDELEAQWEIYNIYDQKNEVSRLPSTLTDKDGIILATTVEWLGIGGYMTSFLDALWLYADRDKLKDLYMQPVVISTTYGEREGMLTLESAWETLGGKSVGGVCGYIDDITRFRSNASYREYIEKKIEDLYRSINRNLSGLPKSSQAVAGSVARSRQMILTPQESQQLSEFNADEDNVRRQKVNVKELSKIYSQMLGDKIDEPTVQPFVKDFENHFKPQPEVAANFLFNIEGMELPLVIMVNNYDLECSYKEQSQADIVATLEEDVMDSIVSGLMTFQRAFSVGKMRVKGSFTMLRYLDELFVFS